MRRRGCCRFRAGIIAVAVKLQARRRPLGRIANRGDSRLGLEQPRGGCAEDALGNAIRSVNRPQLTMVYLRSHNIQTAEAHGIRIPILVADK